MRCIAKFIYIVIRPYIKIDKWKDPASLHFYFSLNIFGETVARIEYSDYEIVEHRILK